MACKRSRVRISYSPLDKRAILSDRPFAAIYPQRFERGASQSPSFPQAKHRRRDSFGTSCHESRHRDDLAADFSFHASARAPFCLRTGPPAPPARRSAAETPAVAETPAPQPFDERRGPLAAGRNAARIRRITVRRRAEPRAARRRTAAMGRRHATGEGYF